MVELDHGSSEHRGGDAVVRYDAGTGEVADTSGACREVFGDGSADLRGQAIDAIVRPGTTGGLAPTDETLLRRARSGRVRTEWEIRWGGDGQRVVEVDVRTEQRGGTEYAVARLRRPPTHDATSDHRYRERYRALFENGQLALWEFDLSVVKDRIDDVPVPPGEISTYLRANPDVHERLLADIEVRDVNGTAVDLYGADSREHLMANVDRVMTEASMETLTGLWQNLATGETGFRAECEARTLDGERRHVLVEASVPDAFADDYARTYVTALDITERTERERELERSRQRYRALFETDQLVLWEQDFSRAKRYAERLAETTDDLAAYLKRNPSELADIFDRIDVLNVNQNTLDYYGAESKRELDENLDELLTEESKVGMAEIWAGIVEGETCFRRECEARSLDGEVRYELLEMNVPEFHADDYDRVYTTTVDITERKRREQELERKNEHLDEFADVISHDLATPLSVIRNSAELVERTGDPEHAEVIREEAAYIQELIDDLHELAKQGKRVGETRSVDLEVVAREAWLAVPATPDVTLSVESSRTFDADPDRLRQLLTKLMENAVQHASPTDASPPAGSGRAGASDAVGTPVPADGTATTVTVRVGTLPDGFYVEDDGDGLPDGDDADVFERGYTTDPDGSGHGLAIARRVAEGHGWQISATENADGGARFEIRTDG